MDKPTNHALNNAIYRQVLFHYDRSPTRKRLYECTTDNGSSSHNQMLVQKRFCFPKFPRLLTRYRSQLMMPFSPETPKSPSSYPSPKTPSKTHMAFRPCCHGKTKKTGRLQRRDHAAAAHPDPISPSLSRLPATTLPATTFLERAVMSSPRLFHFFVPV